MSDYDSEKAAFSDEVEREAARLLRDGLAAPWDAIRLARDNVLVERRLRAARQAGERLKQAVRHA